MSDIVERLRDLAKYHPVDMTKEDCLEAADEIVRLRVEQLDAGLVFDRLEVLQTKNERLHMELIKASELIDADLLARAVKAENEIEQLRKELAEERAKPKAGPNRRVERQPLVLPDE